MTHEGETAPRVPWRDYDPGRPPQVSDIVIQRVYEVICEPCGGSVIDAPRTYAKALESRRRHFANAHAHRAPTTG